VLDAITSLAFAMHSSKGVYALFLGSGLATAAGIPTGWDITLDLVRRAAAVAGVDPGADAHTWYRTKYGRDPDYSELLDTLAKTPADRPSWKIRIAGSFADSRSGFSTSTTNSITSPQNECTLASQSAVSR